MTINHLRRFNIDEVALFLDLDGTLVSFAPSPEGVGPDVTRNSLLRDISVLLEGRMAIVSGRSIADLDRILEGRVVALAGSHGLQRRDARFDLLQVRPHPRLQDAATEITAFAERFPDVLIEKKPLSVAFHYRSNPSVETVAEVFANDLAERTGLRLQRGNMVAEFLSPGMDKGKAIRAFMIEPPFAGSTPIFLGDDLTDEDGFRTAQALGGQGVLVGPPRETAAHYRLESVDAVHAWLAHAVTTKIFQLEVSVESSDRRI